MGSDKRRRCKKIIPIKAIFVRSKQMFKKVIKWWFLDPLEKKLVRHPVNTSRNKKTGDNGFILVQTPADHYYLCLYGTLIRELKKDKSVTIAGIYPDVFSLRPRRKIFLVTDVVYTVNAFLIRRKWKKLYRAVGIDFFVPLENNNPQARKHAHARAKSFYKALREKNDLIDLSIDGINCGELVYDTYLRYEAKPTVDIADEKLLFYLAQCYNIFYQVKSLIARYDIKQYFSSYSTYIQHGVPVRILLNAGVDVITSGNLQQKFKRLSVHDMYHTAPQAKYLQQFNQMDQKEKIVAAGTGLLESKFSGKIDRATSYMKTSVYAERSDGDNAFKKRYDGVIFLHDFFDSPHIYSSMLFPDFYEWVKFTFDVISRNKLNVGVKPHPNQSEESMQVINELKHFFPGIEWIDPSVSNLAIMRSGLKFGISVYGTVLHELAYHGINPICAGDNPHSAFSFVHMPHTLKEYENLILQGNTLTLPDNYREQVAVFYYMHNVNNTDDYTIPLGLLKEHNVFNSDSKLIDKTLLAAISDD